MVQILPQRTNVGSQIGQALGAGIQQGSQQGLQRGLLNQALSQSESVLSNPDASYQQKLIALMKAGAGIPGSERYLATLMPLLANPAMAQSLFGPQGGGSGQQTIQDVIPSALGVPPTEPSSQNKPGIGLSPGGQQQPGGFLPDLMNEGELHEFATNYAQKLSPFGKDPTQSYQEGYAIAQARNAQREKNLDDITQEAIKTGKIKQEDAPYARQIFQKFGRLPRDQVITSGTREFQLFNNARNKLRRTLIPGTVSGAAEKGAFGFLGKMLTGGTTRDEALKRVQGSVKDLVDMGFEDEARQQLTKSGLSPTEVEEAIFPLPEKTNISLRNFRTYSPGNEELNAKKLSDFFLKNVDPKTSLLVLRHKLWNEKGYRWEDIGPAIREAMTQGLQLTPQQDAEMSVVESDPPKQSLIDIFRGWKRPMEFIKGSK